MPRPETHYARSGDVSVAYQVVGDGRFDIVHVRSGIRFEDRGPQELERIRDEWHLYRVDPASA